MAATPTARIAAAIGRPLPKSFLMIVLLSLGSTAPTPAGKPGVSLAAG